MVSGITKPITACVSSSRLSILGNSENVKKNGNFQFMCTMRTVNMCRSNHMSHRSSVAVCKLEGIKTLHARGKVFFCGEECLRHKKGWSICEVKLEDSILFIYKVKNNNPFIFRPHSKCSDLPAVKA